MSTDNITVLDRQGKRKYISRPKVSAGIIHADDMWVASIDTPDGHVTKRCATPGPLLNWLNAWGAQRSVRVEVVTTVGDDTVRWDD